MIDTIYRDPSTRISYVLFVCLMSFAILMSFMIPSVFAAETTEPAPIVECPAINWVDLPFTEDDITAKLGSKPLEYFIIRHIDGSYRIYCFSSNVRTKYNSVKISSTPVDGLDNAFSLSYSNVFYIDTSADGVLETVKSTGSNTYFWCGYNNGDEVYYTPFAIYSADGETLLYPVPPIPQVETILNGVTGYSGQLFGIATQTMNFVTSNPLALVCFILTLFGFGMIIVKSLTKGV